jgi:hypothetical protein
MQLPIALLYCCGLAATAAADPPAFPYKAYITGDNVYVRSGPGENYYPTDKLKAGQEIEVYRHDPGGWYAIRPPQGSFSWVAGRQLQVGDRQLATVVDERTPARVGSRLSDVREVVQVRLHRGEVVEVLGVKYTGQPSSTGANTWYHIAPPSGEFRWVSARWVDRDYARDGVRKNALADGTAESASAARQGWTSRTAEPAARNKKDPYAPAPPVAAESEPRAIGNEPPRRMTADQFQKELGDLDVELSAIVVEEPTVWEFSDIGQRAKSLLSQAETALERGRARLLVSKIARFEDIKQRYLTVGTVREETDRAERQLTQLAARPVAAATTENSPRYDATGQLRRVSTSRAGLPQYALVDARGKLVCYVTPTPGLNLHAYLGRQIGITGTRGFIADQRADHYMVEHVAALQDATLR